MAVEKPYISVIIPAYNEEKYLPSCLAAIDKQQTVFPYETIVVDNNSTDKTGKIAKRFGARVIIEKNQGRAYARQAGAKHAHGEILAYTEADTIVPPRWLEMIGTNFRNHPDLVGLTGNFRFIHSTWFLSVFGPLSLMITSPFYKLFTGNHIFRGNNFAIRSKTLKKINGFNPKAVPYDDIDLAFRAGKYGVIDHLPNLNVFTSDRRFRGRLMQFTWEYLTSYPKIVLFKKRGSDNLYGVIR